MRPAGAPDWLEEVERTFRSVRDRVRERYARPPEEAEVKDDRTVVTSLDHELEAYLAERLLALDATHGLVGEEGGRIREGEPTWHLDPLDGTHNFHRRISRFACQAALVAGGRPIFAVVYEPLLDDLTWAAAGAGTWREGRRVRVAGRPLEETVLLVDVSRRGRLVRTPALLARLRRSVYRVRALGSIAVQLRDVATGAADAFYGSRGGVSALHDLGPGLLLVQEAGGMATDEAGRDALAERRSLLAASPDVHAGLLALLRDVPDEDDG